MGMAGVNWETSITFGVMGVAWGVDTETAVLVCFQASNGESCWVELEATSGVPIGAQLATGKAGSLEVPAMCQNVIF